MTYCVGVLLEEGLIFASDSRTHAGVDNFAEFCKMAVFERPGDRVIVLLSSGGLAGTQAILSVLASATAADGRRTSGPAHDVRRRPRDSDATREIERRDGPCLKAAASFNASFIFGGQIKGEPVRLFRTYAETNFIEADATRLSSDRRNQVRKAHPRLGDQPDHQSGGRDQVRAGLLRLDHAQ